MKTKRPSEKKFLRVACVACLMVAVLMVSGIALACGGGKSGGGTNPPAADSGEKK